MNGLLVDGPADAPLTVALAHGAGAAMDTPFMNRVAQGLAGGGLRVVRFEFPYMARSRAEGRRLPPNRAPVLIETWQRVIGRLGPEALVIGGKSMGGRIASMVADAAGVRGVVCLGYPFHPPSRPEQTRTDHLATMRTPTLICQGTRDPFGTAEDVPAYDLSPAIRLHWLPDGDHGFAPRKASGHSLEGNLDDAIAAILPFIDTL